VIARLAAHLEHPAVREWAQALFDERQALWKSRGLGEQAEAEIGHVKVGSSVKKTT
jgi:putative hydrolase of HD superfamily